MKKKFLSLLLAIVMVCSLLPTVAFADDETDYSSAGSIAAAKETYEQTENDNFWYVGADEMTDSVYAWLEMTSETPTYTLYVGGSGAMQDWGVGTEAPWYTSSGVYSKITQVVFKEGVTHVGEEMLDVSKANGNHIAVITFEADSRCESIGPWAFQNTSIESITIPKNVTSFDGRALAGSGVKNITVEEGNTCFKLGEDNNLYSSDGSTLVYNTNLDSSFTVPNTVTSIGACAFQGYSNFTSITIPDDLTSIGAYAFWQCSNLEGTITIPNSVKSIGNGAFGYCRKLNIVFQDDSECTFIGNDAFAYTAITSFNNPSGVTEWPERMFMNDEDLESITIPATVTSFSSGVFGRSGITNITIEEGNTVVKLGEDNNLYSYDGKTFLYWTGFAEENASLVIPEGVTEIGNHACDNRPNLTSVTIPEGVVTIGPAAFRGTGIADLVIPASVEYIGDTAFYSWNHTNVIYSLKTVTFAEGSRLKAENGYLFAGYKSLKKIELPDGLTKLGYYSFGGCTGLEEITIPASVKIFEEKVFMNVKPTKVTICDVTYTSPTEKGITLGAADNMGTIQVPASTAVTTEDGLQFTLTNSIESAAPFDSTIIIPADTEITMPNGSTVKFDKDVTSRINDMSVLNIPAGTRISVKPEGGEYGEAQDIAAGEMPTTGDIVSIADCTEANAAAAGYADVSDMRTAMKLALERHYGKSFGSNIVLKEVTALNSGTVNVIMPYPDGADADCSIFLIHRKVDGTFEYPAVTKGNGKTSFTLDGNSPILFGWVDSSGGGGGSSGGGGGSSAPATYSISVKSDENGEVSSSVKTAAKGATVTITAAADKGFKLEALTVKDASDNEITLTTEQEGSAYTFTMPASNVTVFAAFAEIVNPFTDVIKDAFCYDAVMWAVENGITSGIDTVHFSPNDSCTRAQMVTFLWRLAGSPEPEAADSKFMDVKTDAYYYKAVLWATENGVTEGTSTTTFSPGVNVSRCQTITFLWRYSGKPVVSADNPFMDVKSGAYYYNAVLWGKSQGITEGTGDSTFSPKADCTRGQIVTFLYRSVLK